MIPIRKGFGYSWALLLRFAYLVCSIICLHTFDKLRDVVTWMISIRRAFYSHRNWVGHHISHIYFALIVQLLRLETPSAAGEFYCFRRSLRCFLNAFALCSTS